MNANIKLWKAKVTEVSQYAKLELENGKTFELPSTYVTPDGLYHLDQDDDVLIHIDDEGNVMLVIPFKDQGLSIWITPIDGEYLIQKIEVITKDDFDDL